MRTTELCWWIVHPISLKIFQYPMLIVNEIIATVKKKIKCQYTLHMRISYVSFLDYFATTMAMGSQQNVRSLSQKSEGICVQYERRFRWRARCPLWHQIGPSVSEARRSGALPLTGMKWKAQPVRGGQKTDTTRIREEEEEALLHRR